MNVSFPAGASRADACESAQDIGVNDAGNATIGEIVERRFGRRALLKGMLAGTACAALPPSQAPAENTRHSFVFREVPHGGDRTHHVADGYQVDVLIRWGDPVTADAPAFDPLRQSAAAQQRQFGYNNDHLAFLSLPQGNRNPDRGLLVVIHEYTNEELMFPGVGRQNSKDRLFCEMTRELVEIEMAAHGLSVIEIRKTEDGRWAVVHGSPYARRIDGLASICEISGPAPRLRTRADTSGRQVIGTLNNCAGGVTPWGTVLSSEENINGYFGGRLDDANPEARNHKRYGVPGDWYNWARYYERFDVGKEPNEANRYGWVVEIDPYDPQSQPRKRTALGRTKHEGAGVVLNRDNRIVVYSGDDERFEYVYRFVSDGRQPAGQYGPAGRRDVVCRPLRCRRHRHLAAAGLRAGPADGCERVSQPGGRADRGAARRRSAWSHEDGPAGGDRNQSGERQGLRHHDQQFPP